MKRSAGILAMVLGVLGIVLSVFAGLWSARLVTGAGDFVTDVVSGVETSLQRVEDRIVFASRGETPDSVQERLGAVRDGFAGATEAANGLRSHPLVSLLPVDVEGLEIAAGQVFIDDAREDTEGVLSDASDGLASARERLADFGSSLRLWTRVAAVFLLLMALWSVWAQYHLVGWGWKAWRTNPPEV